MAGVIPAERLEVLRRERAERDAPVGRCLVVSFAEVECRRAARDHAFNGSIAKALAGAHLSLVSCHPA